MNSFLLFSTTPAITLEIYNPESIHLQEIHHEEGGVKGVAFSSDGKFLGVCCPDIADPTSKVLIYSTQFED